ncbi:MAG: hypothetical protein F9K46_05615 [Anaerolineae bacterium]|nr:MAG: hypothetical protein F9K46_05615 [Anaerolineae bacterium]
MTLNDGLFNLGHILSVQDVVALLKVVLEAGRYIRRFHQPPGMYEVLEHHARLELHDIKGKKATYFKDQKVRFLQNHIMAYQDQAWGDGNIFADYKCSPGVAVDRYQQGNVWRILISLRQTKHKGDLETFHIERSIEDGFIKTIEHFQARIDHPTQHLSMSVTFPVKRFPKHVAVVAQNTNRTIELNVSNIQTLPNGQTLATWSMEYPKVGEAYNLRWEW